MPDLIAKPALSSAPFQAGALRLSESPLAAMTSIALFPGQDKAIAKILKPLGLGFPAPNTMSQSAGARLIWTGRDQAFLIGLPAPAIPTNVAALTDQSDGWAGLQLQGPGAHDALMRWVPLDLRPAAFPAGQVARAPVNHMQAIIQRLSPELFEVLVFRSMARTAWHEIQLAMSTIEARAARPR